LQNPGNLGILTVRRVKNEKGFLAPALCETVTYLLIRCYIRFNANQANHRNGDSKGRLFFLVSFGDTRQWLKECFCGYQQVIHNRKMPTGVVIKFITTPNNNKIEAVVLYKSLYIQVINRIANRW
jgi:hypothetical protein